jgi:tetratricopeptide (TPR) repeat protein
MVEGFRFDESIHAPPPQAARDSTGVDHAMQEAAAGDALAEQAQFAAARLCYEQAIHLQPNNAKFHWLTGVCEWKLGQHDSAGWRLMAAVRIDPKFAPAHALLGEWYLIQGMVDKALDSTATAINLEPENHGIIASRAAALEAAGELDAAWGLVLQLVARGQMSQSLAIWYGRLARGRGHEQQGLILIDQILRSGKHTPPEAYFLHLTAANLLDGLGQYDDAFANAARANMLVRPLYDPAAHARTFDRIINYFTRLRMNSLPKSSYRSERPVFIVGMPRSGTSLAEQILATHPDVFGAGELDFFYRVFNGMLGMLSVTEKEYPECLNSLSVDEADGMAQIYLQPLTALSPRAVRITDKMPLNFMHLGLIAILFPEARIIHCKRDPMDACFSCFMTGFTKSNDFKYDLTHLGLFHRQYERMMEHWKGVIDLPILDVVYEEMVADTEQQSRRMIEFLGLPWDDRCLKFHETKRPVTTGSVQQVRKPIYNSSVGRWRHYEKHLTSLKQALRVV